jgi:hypothetical protein
MKMLILLSVVLSSVASFAAGSVEFKENSFYGSSSKKVIKAAIEKSCRRYVENGWPIVESTTTSDRVISYAIPSVSYQTIFLVDGMDSDNMHPSSYRILVKSLQYDNSELMVQSVVCNY